MPTWFQVLAETIEDDDELLFCTSDTIPVTPNSDGKVFIQLNPNTTICMPGNKNLEPHRRYKAMIMTENKAGQRSSISDIYFSKLCVTHIELRSLALFPKQLCSFHGTCCSNFKEKDCIIYVFHVYM